MKVPNGEGLARNIKSNKDISTIIKYVSDDNNDKSGVGHKIINSPKIKTVINKKLYIALVDTGASASVCSEVLYNAIKQSGVKLIAMPTCGLYCSTAIGHKKQRIKLQCMIPIKIGDRTIEIIVLVIPNLVSDLIIRCNFLSEWETSIDFERYTTNRG